MKTLTTSLTLALAAILVMSSRPASATTVTLFSDDSPTVSSPTSLPVGNWDGLRHNVNTGTVSIRNGISTTDSGDPGANSSRLLVFTAVAGAVTLRRRR